LPIWSCTIYQINPAVSEDVKKMLQTVNKEYTYKNIEGHKLTFYIQSGRQNKYGQLIEIAVDDLLKLYNREKGTYYTKITFNITLQIFQREPVNNFVAIFGNSRQVRIFRMQFTEVFRREKRTPEFPLFSVRFLLRERESCLRKEFPDMREINVSNIRDMYVSGVVIKGSFLEESPEYSKYILDEEIGGIVRHFGITSRDIKERVIILASDGRIYTRMGREPVEVDTVCMILSKLKQCDAVRVGLARYRSLDAYRAMV